MAVAAAEVAAAAAAAVAVVTVAAAAAVTAAAAGAADISHPVALHLLPPSILTSTLRHREYYPSL